jgi:hypothetical protein
MFVDKEKDEEIEGLPEFEMKKGFQNAVMQNEEIQDFS